MKTQHLIIAAGAVALVVYLATRRTSNASALATAASRNAQVSARFRQQLWSEVAPDFYV